MSRAVWGGLAWITLLTLVGWLMLAAMQGGGGPG